MDITYHPVLVALSLVIAVFASYTGLELAASIAQARGRVRQVWLAGGSLAMGIGIWSMHFVGMLAVSLAGHPIRYGVPFLLLSILAAMIGSAIAFSVASRPSVGRLHLGGAALAMGSAIAGMHYLGMWGMHMSADIHWDGPLVLASIAVAVAASWAALRLSLHTRSSRGERGFSQRLLGSLVLGGAIAGMHYVGMAAARFQLAAEPSPLTLGYLLATPHLAVAVTLSALLLLALGMAAAPIQRELARRSALAEENARLAEASLALNERLELLLQETEARKREAEEANRSKSEFLAVMSHELRTPLTAMIGYSELLLDDIPVPIPGKARESVQRIRLSANHLLSLIEELLTFSRIEAAREEVYLEPVELPGLLQEVESIAAPLAQSKGLAFRIEPRPVAGTLVTDERKAKQILLNLLSNAVKFTEAGSVSLETRQEEHEVVFQVRDTGHGIAPEHLEKIFDPFWQVDGSLTRQAGGTGLGLAICAQFARMLGGSLEVESEPKRGSTFTLRLPVQGHSHLQAA